MITLLPVLRCPACRAAPYAAAGGGGVACAACGGAWPDRDGVLHLPVAAAPAGDAAGAIAAYYDDTAAAYELAHGIGRAGGTWSISRKYVPFVAPHLTRDDAVLEIGAGTGKLTAELARLVRLVVPTDIAPGMLRHGRAVNGMGPAVVADAAALPFRDAAFDAVVAMNALSYCVRKDRALAETFRVLKPGGRLILIDMNYLLHLPYLLLGLAEWSRARLWTRQLLESTPWSWRRRLGAAGFEIAVRTEFNWVPHRFPRVLVEPWWAAVDAGLSRVPLLRRCAMRIGIVARRPAAP